ncbi:hypothetical protein PROFUN_07055 [Planoprotostelium fungivorum]|uniref:Uncharacterized protein n=1 Tax=Planoprotostelium fungivorum TaxID=1890364 RepID=A0A2P6NN07_9EUKA|nr:hypothetical protein PROFUN_07055 [Planoprotostelium fungivorum]
MRCNLPRRSVGDQSTHIAPAALQLTDVLDPYSTFEEDPSSFSLGNNTLDPTSATLDAIHEITSNHPSPITTTSKFQQAPFDLFKNTLTVPWDDIKTAKTEAERMDIIREVLPQVTALQLRLILSRWESDTPLSAQTAPAGSSLHSGGQEGVILAT